MMARTRDGCLEHPNRRQSDERASPSDHGAARWRGGGQLCSAAIVNEHSLSTACRGVRRRVEGRPVVFGLRLGRHACQQRKRPASGLYNAACLRLGACRATTISGATISARQSSRIPGTTLCRITSAHGRLPTGNRAVRSLPQDKPTCGPATAGQARRGGGGHRLSGDDAARLPLNWCPRRGRPRGPASSTPLVRRWPRNS